MIKKYKILIAPTILLLLSIKSLLQFNRYLFSTIGVLLINCLPFVLLYAGLFSSKIMKIVHDCFIEPDSIHKIAIALIAISILILFSNPHYFNSFDKDFTRYKKQREEVVEMIRNGSLEPYLSVDDKYWYLHCEHYRLPKGYESLSDFSKIIVYHDEDLGLIVHFYYLFGDGEGSIIILYTEETVGFIGKYKNKDIRVYSLEKLEDHWYCLQTRWD